MTKKNLKKLARSIERKNKAFDAMEPRAKRVAIARDVIENLKSKKLVARAGSYLMVRDGEEFGQPYFNNFYGDDGSNKNGSFQETLNSIPQCQVCAKGAIFACTVMRRNQVKNNQVPYNDCYNWTGDSLFELLGNIFSPMQLRLIEVEFEREDIEWQNHMISGADKIKPLMQLDERFDTDEDRLIAIMKNIIRNRGTFRPDKETWHQIWDN
jgi:hypothetical protein